MSSSLSLLFIAGVADVVDDIASACRSAGFVVAVAADAADAGHHDAVVVAAPDAAALAAMRDRPGLAALATDRAVVVVAAVDDADAESALLQLGVEAIVDADRPHAVPRAVRHAVVRKQVERSARTAYATDLATGLPHQAQLVEHMTQLLALREREPAPMVLVVLRIEGYAGAAARGGSEAANVLRRKVAVRLRAALRASDVVAAIAADTFGVLLGRIESAGDGERVAAKLVRSLQQPFMVAGQPNAVATSVGIAVYPDHGTDAATLLQRAGAQAGSVATLGRDDGVAAKTERGPSSAANDPG